MRIGIFYAASARKLRIGLLFYLALIVFPSVCLAAPSDATHIASDDLAYHPGLVRAELVEINDLENQRFIRRGVGLRKICIDGRHNPRIPDPSASARPRPAPRAIRPVITGPIVLFFYFHRASHNGNGGEDPTPPRPH